MPDERPTTDHDDDLIERFKAMFDVSKTVDRLDGKIDRVLAELVERNRIDRERQERAEAESKESVRVFFSVVKGAPPWLREVAKAAGTSLATLASAYALWRTFWSHP